MLEGGFLDDDEDFNRELESATTAEENVEGKKVYVCEICAKECVSSRGLKRHGTLKHTRESTSKTEEKAKKTVSPTLQMSQFEETVKECAKLCHRKSCLPEDTRNMFDSFELDSQDAVDLWEILEPVITKFHGDAEKFYCSFHGLLQNNLLPNKFGGDISYLNEYIIRSVSMHGSRTKKKKKFTNPTCTAVFSVALCRTFMSPQLIF